MRLFHRVPSIATNIFWLVHFNAVAQSPFAKYQNLFTTPNNYVVTYTNLAPVIDGDVEDNVWKKASWSANFQDIEGERKPHPALQTNVKMLWDDSCLYIAARISDPNVWANLKKHDEIIFHDNDFEVFIDPLNIGHHYFEIEYNALNTVFDLLLNKPYRVGGNALISWDVKGLRSAVKVNGTINDPADKDVDWTLEMAIPFESLSLFNHQSVPNDSTLWRINFSRVEWDTKTVDGKYVKLKNSAGQNLPEHNWVWSPQGVINMHFPERWGYLLFTHSQAKAKDLTFPPYAELQKRYLWLAYYQQADELKKHGNYELSLYKLGDKSKVVIDGMMNTLTMEATKHQFMVFITDEKNQITYSLNQEGLVGQLKK